MHDLTDLADLAIDLDAWERDGYLYMPGVLSADELADLRAWTDDIAARPADHSRADGLLQHYELTEEGAQIARSENLVPNHAGFAALIDRGRLPAIAAALLGEPVVTYKEKINYKLAGGAGFAPHQDARAYKFVATHLSGMVAIDDATPENGCLEVVAGRHHELLEDNGDGCIHPDIVDSFDWQRVPMKAGDLLWFHSRAPHRSGPNTTRTTRRGLFCTYNAASLGDLRRAYYADKLEYFRSRGHEASRVSTIGDFLGRNPTADDLRAIGVQQ
jgi:hypothetical protein